MCLSTQALVLFLSLLPQDIVEPSVSAVLVRAETGDVIWHLYDDVWCTTSPLVRQTREG